MRAELSSAGRRHASIVIWWEKPTMTISPRPASIAQRLLPVLGWLPTYRRDWLLPDALAGLAVWAVMVPESMAYAGIVGVPPIMGLYTIVPPLIAYALLGTSRLLVVGPDTATGLISALTVGAIAVQGTAEFNTLTSSLAILIGALFLLFGALRMGWVAAFIPTPVMRGFIEGLVCVTIIGQVPHLLGIEGTYGNFFVKLWFVLRHLPDAALLPVLTGVLSLTVMLLLHRLVPRVPAALIVAVVATILIGLFDSEAAGVSVVGDLPSGLPHAGSVNAVVPGHAAPGACRDRHRSNVAPRQARLFARPARPQSLGVRHSRVRRRGRANVGRSARHRARRGPFTAVVDLSNQPPGRGGARPASRRGGLSRRPAPPRGAHLPRAA